MYSSCPIINLGFEPFAPVKVEQFDAAFLFLDEFNQSDCIKIGGQWKSPPSCPPPSPDGFQAVCNTKEYCDVSSQKLRALHSELKKSVCSNNEYSFCISYS